MPGHMCKNIHYSLNYFPADTTFSADVLQQPQASDPPTAPTIKQ